MQRCGWWLNGGGERGDDHPRILDRLSSALTTGNADVLPLAANQAGRLRRSSSCFIDWRSTDV